MAAGDRAQPAGKTVGMDITRRITLATGCLALVLTAGCSDVEDPADTEASGGTSAAATDPDTQGDAVTLSTLTGDATRLSLDAGVIEALSAVGVELTATGGAEAETAGGTTTFVFPVTGGEATVDPAGSPRFTGTVEHDGGLQLSALGRSATADELVLDGEAEQLTAMVGDRRVPLLPLALDPQVTTEDDGATVTYSAASLDTGTVDDFAEQLGLPTLPALEVNELEATLEGS